MWLLPLQRLQQFVLVFQFPCVPYHRLLWCSVIMTAASIFYMIFMFYILYVFNAQALDELRQLPEYLDDSFILTAANPSVFTIIFAHFWEGCVANSKRRGTARNMP